MCFKRKTSASYNADDKKIIKGFTGKVKVLLVYAEDEETKGMLKELLFKVEHLSVSPEAVVQGIDRKISNKLDDMKISFAKNKANPEKLREEVKEVEVLLAEREASYNK